MDEDLFSLTTSAKLQWQIAKRAATAAPTRLSALLTCGRAVAVLRGENAKGFSKPVRQAVIYQISSICLKAALSLLHAFAVDGDLVDRSREKEIAAVETCMAALLPPKAALLRAVPSLCELADTESSVAELPPTPVPPPITVKERVLSAVGLSFAGLRECRRLDAFDFKSVYRVSWGIAKLGSILSADGADVAFPLSVVQSLPDALGLRDLSARVAMEEMSRLFDRKRSQVVAMWCVESAISPWEKVRSLFVWTVDDLYLLFDDYSSFVTDFSADQPVRQPAPKG